MSKTYVLCNHLAGNNAQNTDKLDALIVSLGDRDIERIDVANLSSYSDLFARVCEDDEIYLCGGDGTLNRFVNGFEGDAAPCNVYYYAMGTGNDFLKDIGKSADGEPILINKYITGLPYAYVNGEKRKFINNVGFGIDGYCCEVGDKLKLKSDKPVNYTSIAIKGLLGGYKPANARVTVDGREYSYNNVWIAPTMNGRYYGGGMMAAPTQDRLDPERRVSFVVMYGAGKLRTLMLFPSIFKGNHIKKQNMVEVHQGHDIKVVFDRPTSLQIDGETYLGITEYSVKTR